MNNMPKINMVTLEFVLEKMENKVPIQIVEALSPEEYNDGHLPGAVNIPQKEVSERAKDLLEKEKPVIVYCAGYSCHSSTIVSTKLMELGYSEVYDFKGGKSVWKNAGLDLTQKIANSH